MQTRGIVGALVLMLAGGCATAFSGAPKIKGGRAKCETVCAGWNMELAGMVQMGEYSNGCICEVPGRANSSQAAAAAGEAVAGVWMQMQAAAQQQQASAAHHYSSMSHR